MIQEVENEDNFKDLRSQSYKIPQWLFKLSPICPTSFQAEFEMEAFVKEGAGADLEQSVWRINVVKQRALSRAIASEIGVTHESPQALLFVGGKVVWDASHYRIRKADLKKALEGNSPDL